MNRASLLVAACLTASVSAQSPALRADRDPAELRTTLDAIVPALTEDYLAPGAAVALVVDGKTAWIAGYGYANAERRQPVTADTVFNIGSISKTVAAWGVMKLVEEGRIDLDAPVERYLTRWHLPESAFDTSGVTMRRLLSHTAGLSLHGYPGFQPTEPLPTIEASLSGATNGPGAVYPVMEPGTKWQYSGGGYTLAQLVLEEVSGRRFHDYMTDEILTPLDMTSSAYEWPERITRLAATPYDALGRPIPGPRFTAAAAAGLQTTARDLARFVEASLAPRVLQTATVRLMQRPANDASPNYGLGYGVDRIAEGITRVGHGGSNEGWNANLTMVLESGDGILVLTNGTSGGGIIGQVRCAWKEWLTGMPEVCRGAIGPLVISTTLRDGVEAAVARYRELRATRPDAYHMDEEQLNGAGYALLQADRADDALAIFKLNVEVFPAAWNPHDSLGEAYMMRGEVDRAIESYEKSIELNPGNANGAAILERLRMMQRERNEGFLSQPIDHISPEQAAALRDQGPGDVVLLDCREAGELDLARIEGALHLPMSELPDRVDELDHARAYVVFCHSGVRSVAVAAFLRSRGLEQVANMTGGIDAWSRTVDPSVPRY